MKKKMGDRVNVGLDKRTNKTRSKKTTHKK